MNREPITALKISNVNKKSKPIERETKPKALKHKPYKNCMLTSSGGHSMALSCFCDMPDGISNICPQQPNTKPKINPQNNW